MPRLQIADPIVFPSLEEVNTFPHGWDVDFSALKAQQTTFRMERLETDGMVLSIGGFSGPTLQRGTTPRGMRTFALSPNAAENLVWHRQSAEANSLLVFGDDCELFTTSRAAVDICTVSISNDRLDEVLGSAGGDTLSSEACLSLLQDDDLAEFYRNFLMLARFLSEAVPSDKDYNKNKTLLEEQLQLDLVMAATAHSVPCTVSRAKSYHTVQAALEYILTHLRDPVRITALAREMGVSVRTLELCFKKHLDVPPKRVINLLRLSAVRRELLAPETNEATVSNTAGNWNFWHLGQFSADYHVAFGELPSRTLARTLRKVAPAASAKTR